MSRNPGDEAKNPTSEQGASIRPMNPAFGFSDWLSHALASVTSQCVRQDKVPLRSSRAQAARTLATIPNDSPGERTQRSERGHGISSRHSHSELLLFTAFVKEVPKLRLGPF